MRNQVKTYSGDYETTTFVDVEAVKHEFNFQYNPEIACFTDSPLNQLKLVEIQKYGACDLQRKVTHVKSNNIPKDRLVLKFEAVDTDELKGIEIKVEGDKAIYKVGEGETANYHIPNDKKLWETQFMVCSIDGKFYLRDMGFVHNSRVKLDHKCNVQIQKGSVVDLGKVVHYHFDKVVHAAHPKTPSNDKFFILRPEQQYEVDNEDFPYIRARPVWVSADENEENIQNEIHVNADGNKNSNTLGRSMKRDIQIKLKAVSADHCGINYNPDMGWTITEKGKDKCSSNGTYIFLKSQEQMKDHMPSDLIPVQDDMIISFVNYELRVRLEAKKDDEIKSQQEAQHVFFSKLQQDYEAAAHHSKDIAPPTQIIEEKKEEHVEPKQATPTKHVEEKAPSPQKTPEKKEEPKEEHHEEVKVEEPKEKTPEKVEEREKHVEEEKPKEKSAEKPKEEEHKEEKVEEPKEELHEEKKVEAK